MYMKPAMSLILVACCMLWVTITTVYFFLSSRHSSSIFAVAMGSRAEKVIHCKGDVLRELNGLFVEMFGDEEVNLLAGSINRIVEYCSDIAESAINLAMESA